MNIEEHKAAILAAIEAANNDGFHLEITNACGGCCSAFEADLTNWHTQESVTLVI